MWTIELQGTWFNWRKLINSPNLPLLTGRAIRQPSDQLVNICRSNQRSYKRSTVMIWSTHWHSPHKYSGAYIHVMSDLRLRSKLFLQPYCASNIPDSKVHGVNMGLTWVLLAPDGPHDGPMNLAIRDLLQILPDKIINMIISLLS